MVCSWDLPGFLGIKSLKSASSGLIERLVLQVKQIGPLEKKLTDCWLVERWIKNGSTYIIRIAIQLFVWILLKIKIISLSLLGKLHRVCAV